MKYRAIHQIFCKKQIPTLGLSMPHNFEKIPHCQLFRSSIYKHLKIKIFEILLRSKHYLQVSGHLVLTHSFMLLSFEMQ